MIFFSLADANIDIYSQATLDARVQDQHLVSNMHAKADAGSPRPTLAGRCV